MSDVNTKVGMSRKVLTLVYLLEDENILLGLKKRGFGEGKVSSHLSMKFQSKTHSMILNIFIFQILYCFKHYLVEWLWWKS